MLLTKEFLYKNPEIFWKDVEIKPKNDCWEWRLALNEKRYGKKRIGSKNYYAHRIAAWLSGMVADISSPGRENQQIKGFVLHKCDNPSCCNPNHFFIGNQSDNQKDAYAKKRKKSAFNFAKNRYSASSPTKRQDKSA